MSFEVYGKDAFDGAAAPVLTNEFKALMAKDEAFAAVANESIPIWSSARRRALDDLVKLKQMLAQAAATGHDLSEDGRANLPVFNTNLPSQAYLQRIRLWLMNHLSLPLSQARIIHEEISHSDSKPTNQPTADSKPTNHADCKPTNHADCHSTNQPTADSKSTNHADSKPTNHAANHPTSTTAADKEESAVEKGTDPVVKQDVDGGEEDVAMEVYNVGEFVVDWVRQQFNPWSSHMFLTTKMPRTDSDPPGATIVMECGMMRVASAICVVCKQPGEKSCARCYRRNYCSQACQIKDWQEDGHRSKCSKTSKDAVHWVKMLLPHEFPPIKITYSGSPHASCKFHPKTDADKPRQNLYLSANNALTNK